MAEKLGLIMDPPNYDGIFSKLYQLDICDKVDVDLYGAGLADFYNKFVGEYVGDIPIFEKIVSLREARVLDLACGAGRITTALARLGANVYGLDLSRDMLDLARMNLSSVPVGVSQNVCFAEGNICDFELEGEYDLVILGITSISLLLKRSQRQAMFRCVAKHLAEGGKFVFDILDLSEDKWRQLDNYMDVWSCDDASGQDFAIVGQKFYPDNRRFIFNVYRESIDWKGVTTRTMGFSIKVWLEREELIADLATAGLVVYEEIVQGDTRFFVSSRTG